MSLLKFFPRLVSCALLAAALSGLLATRAVGQTSGVLVQWGDTGSGQGAGAPPLAGPYIAIAAGSQHCLALRSDGSLVQWGATIGGQAFAAPAATGPYIAIAAGAVHSLALRADGSLVQWGAASSGQATNAPPAAGPYVAIAAGAFHSLALRADGSLVQWGATSAGQTTNAPPPAGPYAAIAAGTNHSLALRTDGSLVQWGATGQRQNANAPPGAGPYVAVAAGAYHNLALRTDGSLVQWGALAQGQTTNAPTSSERFVAIAAGQYHSLALRSDGTLVQWGDSSQDQSVGAPAAAGPYFAIACGQNHNLALIGPPRSNVPFTYQGRLSGPTGPVDFKFTLHDASTGGRQVGTLTSADEVVPDDQGMFTATVTPGPIDAARPLWLEIRVSPAGAGTFTTLSPRQPISPAPRAGFSERAAIAAVAADATNARNAASVPWSGITGVPTNVSGAFSPWEAVPSGINFAAGRVGIGTSAPLALLHVSTGELFAGLMESSASQGTWLSLRNTSPGGAYWHLISTGGNNLSGAGNFIIGFGQQQGGYAPAITFRSSNMCVGIGTDSPTQRLTVAGNVLANNVAVPSSGRFKHHVMPMVDALEKLLQLEGVSFDWNEEYAKDRPGREHDIGFVAEDVARVFPEVVFHDDEGNVSGMDYSRLTAVAVAAIKQQQAQRGVDRAEIDRLARENSELKARLAAIEAMLRQNRADGK